MRGVSVADALDGAATAIAAGGSPTARLDAEVLLAHVLELDRTTLFLDPQQTVEGPAVRRFQDLVRRRSIGHEPVAYLVGRRGFRHLELEVDSRVLIPRPETEHLVEAVLELAPRGARVLDVGTGSGAIALALADERPDLSVTGSDLSGDALAVAQANATRLDLDVAFVQADLVPAGAWDVIVSNPPYVGAADELAPDVRAHEPHLALFAGADGLDVIRRLVAASVALLVLEVGAGQAAAVEALARGAGFARTERRSDLAGVERVVVAWA